MTASPGLTVCTPRSTSSSHPAFSWPRIYGSNVPSVHCPPPHAFHDMQVGTTQARRTDTHNDLIGGGDGGFGHLLQREIHVHVLVIGVQSRSFHRACSSPTMAPSWWHAAPVHRAGSRRPARARDVLA